MPRRLLLLLCLTLATVRLGAQAPSLPFADLADSASVVVRGRVGGVSVQGDAGSIYTYVTVAVSEVLKGRLTEDTLVVKQLGGELSTLGLYIADQASFAPQEDVLLFLSVRPRDGTLYTVGLSRGKWQVLPDLATGGESAVQGTSHVALDASARQAIAATRAHAEPFVAVPAELDRAVPNYTFIPPGEGGPARWHEADDGVRIPVDYQTIPGGLPGNGSDQLNGAIGAWNSINTRLQVDRAASGSPTCPASTFTGNGHIALYWNDPCGEVGDGDASTFGVGGGFYTPGFQKTIGGVTFNAFLQGLAILNNTGPHLTIAACLQDAVGHLLGHAVGLGHSGDSGALMYATLRNGCSSGSSGVAGDDINGLRAIYPPVASGGTPPNPPTAITNTVALDTVTLSWTPATTGGPAENYIVDASLSPGGPIIASLPTANASTSLVVGGVQPGIYYVRVRARNALGTSGTSPETVVTVGPCDAPGPPTGVGYTIADNFVTLTWTAPASGVTQGYWLYAGLSPGQSDALVTPLGPAPVFAGLAPFGTYFVRLAARNSCSVGPVSMPDLQVNVVPCTSAPLPPVGLTHTRNGNIVTLTWNNPASGNLPSRFELHAGSTSGSSNLVVFPTGNNATSLQAFAPAGTYYVRVRGQNNCGTSGDSNEITVVVP